MECMNRTTVIVHIVVSSIKLFAGPLLSASTLLVLQLHVFSKGCWDVPETALSCMQFADRAPYSRHQHCHQSMHSRGRLAVAHTAAECEADAVYHVHS